LMLADMDAMRRDNQRVVSHLVRVEQEVLNLRSTLAFIRDEPRERGYVSSVVVAEQAALRTAVSQEVVAVDQVVPVLVEKPVGVGKVELSVASDKDEGGWTVVGGRGKRKKSGAGGGVVRVGEGGGGTGGGAGVGASGVGGVTSGGTGSVTSGGAVGVASGDAGGVASGGVGVGRGGAVDAGSSVHKNSTVAGGGVWRRCLVISNVSDKIWSEEQICSKLGGGKCAVKIQKLSSFGSGSVSFVVLLEDVKDTYEVSQRAHHMWKVREWFDGNNRQALGSRRVPSALNGGGMRGNFFQPAFPTPMQFSPRFMPPFFPVQFGRWW
jgi:hypothetical protein